MKSRHKIITAWVITLAVFFSSQSSWASGAVSIQAGFGYGRDSLAWNIAGNINGNSPNIVSELTWSNLEIYHFTAGLKNSEEGNFFTRIFVDYGMIFKGQNQDSDFYGDNRTYEFSRTNNSASKGNVFDGSIAIGYFFKQSWKLKLIPLLGYSFSIQNLTITDGFKIIPPLGSFSGLDSSYDTHWIGPWLGMDILFPFNDLWSLCLSAELHAVQFYATGDWNTRYDLMHPISFEQAARGTNLVLSLKGEYSYNPHASLAAEFNFQDSSTEPGIHRFYFSAGNTLDTRLNEVHRRFYSIIFKQIFKF